LSLKRYDVLIIGGGVTGVSIARELSRYRLSIGLLEKEAELAFGVSKSNSGIVHPGTHNPPDSLKGRLCVEGNWLMREVARDLGVHFEEVGELVVIFKEEERKELLRIKKDAEILGVPGVRIVDRAWLDEHEPNLNSRAIAALYAPTAGIISPYRLVYDLAENAKKNWVEIHTSHQVTGITRKDDFEVCTDQGVFRSRYVINAAGLFADEIANMAGITDIKIVPWKGEEFMLDKKKTGLTRQLLFPLPTPHSKGTLFIRTSDGNPMIGPTSYEARSKTDLSTTEKGLNEVLKNVRRLVPSVNKGDIIAYFAGLRPKAGNDFIIRHEGSVPGFVNVAGIQSPGLTAAPAIALMVVDLLRKNGLELRKSPTFQKHRQPTEHLFAIPFSRTKKLIKQDSAYADIVCRCEMVSAKEVRDAIKRGARTMDGIKFRTRAQAGRCHGGFCTTRLMKILSQELGVPVSEVTKRGKGSEMVKKERGGK